MAELTTNVNWLAVIVGFAAAFALGYAWYGPLFGKKWSQGLGISAPPRPPVVAMAVQAVGTFGLAWLFGVTAGANALATIILIVVTVMALTAAGSLFGQKPAAVVWIETGFVAAMGIVMFAAQALL